MRLKEVQRGGLTLHDGNAGYKSPVLPQDITQRSLAVGDWLIVEKYIHNELWINQYLSTTNHLARRAGDGLLQSIAAI